MQHGSHLNSLSSKAHRPGGQPVSPSSSRRTSLEARSNYSLEPEAQQCLPEPNDAATEDLASLLSGSRVSTDGTSKYNRVAEDDTDGAAPEVDLPNTRFGFVTILTDCAAVALPLGLVALVVIVWRLDGSESTEDSREDWGNAIRILAIIFPILFASVVGRLTYKAARWKLETGTTLGSLEQFLDCSAVESCAMELGDDDPLKETVYNGELSAAAVAVDNNHTKSAKLPNGTWHGYDYTRNTTGLDSTWILALDRFVDRIWSMEPAEDPTGTVVGPLHGRVEEMHRPILFKNEQDIKADPMSLLFESIFPPQEFNTGCSAKSCCRVTQEYVESRVNCTRTTPTGKHNCTVVAQRKSQKQNAPGDISQLSFPAVFDFVSRELPLSIGGSTAYKSEFSLYHLADPGLRHLRGDYYCIIENVTAEDMGIRLSQLLNTYLLISQFSFEIAE
ncbi:hypothetical protein CSAL01_08203 [Colletotrichum salicis]|uniref:Uncharacterized protein n=1 Tax=Colletotrichum salicis TaxID=1209931 RepID=A0A135UNU4_9PEZI|nr:hypothetical protein CSAL01_08203 [Colletotrichum salicis]